ncbi:uncharacterized protein [Heterodontus francisci]|uniref:uncharacterized protein isoform X2 n=1 Tax=Heterodontus francisci TaxID=7792 RepID=UPI00355AF65A
MNKLGPPDSEPVRRQQSPANTSYEEDWQRAKTIGITISSIFCKEQETKSLVKEVAVKDPTALSQRKTGRISLNQKQIIWSSSSCCLWELAVRKLSRHFLHYNSFSFIFCIAQATPAKRQTEREKKNQPITDTFHYHSSHLMSLGEVTGVFGRVQELSNPKARLQEKRVELHSEALVWGHAARRGNRHEMYRQAATLKPRSLESPLKIC